MKVYFAHSKEDYNTEREANALEYLNNFINGDIINPSTDLTFRNNMGGYLGYIRDNVAMLVFMPKDNNFCGKGTYSEILEAQKKNIPIYKITFKRKKTIYLKENFNFSKKNEIDWKNYIKVN